MAFIVDTFSDFCIAAEDYRARAPREWTQGQVTLNLLMVVRPDLAEMIGLSDFNPRLNPKNMLEFYGYLARHWED